MLIMSRGKGQGHPNGPSRREVLGGTADVVLRLPALGGVGVLAENWRDYLSTIPAYKERERLFVDSPYFTDEVIGYMNLYNDPGGRLDESLQYGDQRVVGRFWIIRFREPRSRIQYVRDELMRGEIVETIPEEVRQELSFLAAGMAAVESEFHNDEVSSTDAHGIFQITRSLYEGFGTTDDEMQYLSEQIEVVQRLFAEQYRRLTTALATENDRIRRDYFADNESAFRRAFLAPLLLNAYQAGPERMIEAVRLFLRDPDQDVRGYDLFHAIAQRAEGVVAGYGSQSSAHVVKVYAMALLINARR